MESLEEYTKSTPFTSNMQRYYLACVKEFGEEFRHYLDQIITLAYQDGFENGYNDGVLDQDLS